MKVKIFCHWFENPKQLKKSWYSSNAKSTNKSIFTNKTAVETALKTSAEYIKAVTLHFVNLEREQK